MKEHNDIEKEKDEEELTVEEIKLTLEIIQPILQGGHLILINSGHSFKMGFRNIRIIEKEYNISRNLLKDAMSFITMALHFQEHHKIEDFLEKFTGKDLAEAKQFIEIINAHPDIFLLQFRLFRNNDILLQEIQTTKRKIVTTNGNEISYLNFCLPILNKKTDNQNILNLEMDKLEIDFLINRLQQIKTKYSL